MSLSPSSPHQAAALNSETAKVIKRKTSKNSKITHLRSFSSCFRLELGWDFSAQTAGLTWEQGDPWHVLGPGYLWDKPAPAPSCRHPELLLVRGSAHPSWGSQELLKRLNPPSWTQSSTPDRLKILQFKARW